MWIQGGAFALGVTDDASLASSLHLCDQPLLVCPALRSLTSGELLRLARALPMLGMPLGETLAEGLVAEMQLRMQARRAECGEMDEGACTLLCVSLCLSGLRAVYA